MTSFVGFRFRVALIRPFQPPLSRPIYTLPTPPGYPDTLPPGNFLPQPVTKSPDGRRGQETRAERSRDQRRAQARQLDWPVATVKSRLTKGRLRLRESLTRRGLAPGAVGAVMAVAGETRAAVPRGLVQSTVRAATSCASGAVPTAVTQIVEGVLKMMMWQKLKVVAVGAIVAVGLTAEVLSQQATKDRVQAVQPPRVAAAQSEKLEEKVAVDPRWVRSLPSGATIEVVGVSPHPSGPLTWWKPDGSPLAEAPCDRSNTRIFSDQNVAFRAVVARVTNLPDGAEHQWWINEANGGSHGAATRGGNPVPGLSEVITEFPVGTSTCTVNFKVAAGPWRTVRTWGKNPGSVGSLNGSYIFSDAIATRTGTTLSVTHDILDKSVRLVAVDGDGKEHPAMVRSGGGVKDFRQLVVEFELSPEAIQEFRFQARPYEEVEIPGVVIRATGKN